MTTAPPRPDELVSDDVDDVGAEETPVATAVPSSEPAPAPAPASRKARAPRAPRPRPAPAGTLPTVTRAIGMSLTVLATMLVVILLYALVFANVSESRAQQTLFKTFRGQLADAVAPVGPAAPGAPVAIISVPRLHLRAVVVEGTTSGELLQGPGHRRDTPLPGQPGTSVLYGRSTLAGHPFANLDELVPGDQITVTTGQADAITFSVVGTRDSRDKSTVPTGSTPRLSLVTADPPLKPTHTMIVSAVLTSAPLDAAGTRPAIGASEKALGVDGSALLTVALRLQVLVLLTAVTTWLYVRGPRWTVYVISTPVLVAVVWNIAENLVRMLPNVI